MTKICQHCGKGRITRPRKLCWNCYYTPGVRDLYPSTSKFGRRGPGCMRARSRPPTFPTNALPGSLEKILVLTQRAELAQDLWHVDDASWDGPCVVAQVG